MREFDLSKSFPLVTIPSNTLLLALTQQDQLRTLQCAARHLEPDGRLVFDVFIPGPDLLADRGTTPFAWGKTVHPDTGKVVVMSAVNRADGATQINRETQIFEEYDGAGRIVRRAELPIELRYLFPAECHALIEQAGLVAESVFGGFRRSTALRGQRRDDLHLSPRSIAEGLIAYSLQRLTGQEAA